MLKYKSLLELMKTVARAKPTGTYSYNGEQFEYDTLNETLKKELNELAGTDRLYQQNKQELFALMEETMNEIVPARLVDAYSDFAEIKTYAQGTRPVFTRRTGLTRAKQFITRVGLAGVYEVFKLGSESFELKTSAIGGAAKIGFEEFLDGRVNFAELTNVVMEGMQELIYKEIAQALIGAIGQLPVANRIATNGFDETSMDFLISTASAYGNGSPTIYCTREFAVKMIPDNNWISDAMKDMRWATGTLGNYKGCRVVILPQSFDDESNSRKIIDPSYVWIIPNDGTKPVKVAFEGETHVRERDTASNDDWSRDIQVYRKVGVGVMMTNNICSYRDMSFGDNALDNIPPEVTP